MSQSQVTLESLNEKLDRNDRSTRWAFGATFAFVLIGFGFSMFGLANDQDDATTKGLYNIMAICYMVVGLALAVFLAKRDKK